ncbi:MAG: hypothetical protein V8S76_00795 [Lachnospiraceae bacterium]
MLIVKKGDNFTLRYEKRYDEDNSEASELWKLVCLLCNSSELDFDLMGEGYPDVYNVGVLGYWLYNYNTQKKYLVSPKDAEDFYKGKPIKLEGCKPDDDELLPREDG